VIWKTAGNPPGHGSFIAMETGGTKQIIGYDSETLGGWDVQSGQRRWTLKPPRPGDFNVPTPIAWNGKLVVATENNGTRIYGFDSDGLIVPQPLAVNEDLVPDCHSPVLVNNRLFGVSGGLLCLDPLDNLKLVWRCDSEIFQEYTSLVASSNKLLALSLRGKLVLLKATENQFEILSELQLIDGEEGLYSHPALAGDRIYVRGSKSLVCLDLKLND
jgi:outer membrane protein assembly factor BamB